MCTFSISPAESAYEPALGRRHDRAPRDTTPRSGSADPNPRLPRRDPIQRGGIVLGPARLVKLACVSAGDWAAADRRRPKHRLHCPEQSRRLHDGSVQHRLYPT